MEDCIEHFEQTFEPCPFKCNQWYETNDSFDNLNHHQNALLQICLSFLQGTSALNHALGYSKQPTQLFL